MTALTKGVYSAALVGVMVLFSNCAGCDDPPNPDKAWVICVGGEPMLTDGTNTSDKGDAFFQSDYECPMPESSPIWRGSLFPVYPTKQPSASSSNNAGAKATASLPAYLAHTILDLPLLPLSWSSSTPGFTCDATFPDALQVNHDNALVTRFSTCPFKIESKIPVVTRPLQIAITPDGQTALVTSFDNAVNFIDLATNKVTFTLMTDFDINPHGIAINSDGTRAYITSFNNDNPVVATIDMASRQVISTLFVNAYPQSVYVTPDDTQLYVTFPFGNSVYVIDILTNTIANNIVVPSPRDIAFDSKGTKAYITSASGSPGTVQEVNMTTFQVENTYTVGVGPTDIAVLFGDVEVIVNNYEGKSVSTINTGTGAVKTTPVNGSPVGLAILR
jgi:YVTN family beta-propeller protein